MLIRAFSTKKTLSIRVVLNRFGIKVMSENNIKASTTSTEANPRETATVNDLEPLDPDKSIAKIMGIKALWNIGFLAPNITLSNCGSGDDISFVKKFCANMVGNISPIVDITIPNKNNIKDIS